MELKIQKKDLLKGLERTLSVVERRNTMPSLNHALCELKDGQLQISATDLEIFISSTVPCKSITTGRFAIPARSVFEIVKECPDSQEIHIKATGNNKIEIFSGKSQFKILGLAADSFPHFKTSPKGELTSAKLKCREFVRLLQKTEYAVCTDEIRYFMTGIFFETVEENGVKTIRTVATDGHRLAMQEIPCSQIGELTLRKGLIIPKKGAAELRKLLESTTEDEFELSCDENLMRVNIGDFQLWIRPIDGEYPDYRRVIPSNLPSQMNVSRKDMSNSLRRLNLLVSDRSKVVTFDFSKAQLSLSTINPDLGEATDEVPVSYNGSEFKTGFNVRFFLDAMSYLDGEEVEIKLGEKLQPALIRSKDTEGYQVVIMPMRI